MLRLIDTMIETVSRVAIEMHLPDARRVVPGVEEESGQRRLAFGERGLEQGNTQRTRITTGEERLARSGTDGRVTVGPIEADPLARDPVEVWRPDLLVSVSATDV